MVYVVFRSGVLALEKDTSTPNALGYLALAGIAGMFSHKAADDLLNREIFDTLLEANVIIENWRREYNQFRPHSSLGYRPPAPEALDHGALTLHM